MKTIVPFKTITLSAVLFAAVTVFSTNILAQSGPGGGSSNSNMLSNGLKFDNPTLISGTDKQVGAIYLFQSVQTGIDARVKIDSLVNGAKIDKIDDNSGNGYKDAFQPHIKAGNIGMSYATFTFKFYEAGTTIPTTVSSLNATALDIDGSAVLHEFAKIKVGTGGVATFMSNTLSLTVTQLLAGEFMGIDILGLDHNGIDTSAYGNMFTASNSYVSSFSANYGVTQLTNSSSTRQFSTYMKGFSIPNAATLPLELLSFGATLNKSKVDLNWVTLWERNLSHFEVERSVDGKSYKQVGVVFGIGNSDFKTSYKFSDNVTEMPSGIIYYRLKLMDADGKSGYSEIKIIRIGNNEVINVMTYPNPVVNDLRITVPTNWQGKQVKYEVFNMGGKVMNSVSRSSASQTEVVNMSGFAPGLYIVRVSNGTGSAQQKIIKN